NDIKIIFGGVHVILMPDEVIKYECVDYICTGEGEYVLKELRDKNLNGFDISGIWYKNEGKIVKNEQRDLIQNLDELPFADWDDYNLEKYFQVNVSHMSIMGSRGCPYNCTYCSSHAMRKTLKGKWVRFRSVDNIMEEIEQRIEKYYDRGLRHFQINDDTFILYEDFILDFCRKYIEKGFHKRIIWAANVRANLVTDEIIK
ncbi:MAG: radical SAM protein, partial [bacterium]|nr:radical SAM protein [bacterium]